MSGQVPTGPSVGTCTHLTLDIDGQEYILLPLYQSYVSIDPLKRDV